MQRYWSSLRYSFLRTLFLLAADYVVVFGILGLPLPVLLSNNRGSERDRLARSETRGANRGSERKCVSHAAMHAYVTRIRTQEGGDPQGTNPHRGRPHRGRPTHRGSDPHKGRDPHRRHTDIIFVFLWLLRGIREYLFNI